MGEAVQKSLGPDQEKRAPAGQAGERITDFEPEVIAFCCEH
jgi:hypothetical protein